MITETAHMTIRPGQEAAFEAALDQARSLVEQTPGCLGLTVQRGVERPGVYLITIGWDTLDDHLVGFRESARFPQWRALLSPHFAEPPAVEHWGPVGPQR
jgi:heme-degrading monooxygenase HmoA